MSAWPLWLSVVAILGALGASWWRYERDASARFERLARQAGSGEAYDERPLLSRARSRLHAAATFVISVSVGALVAAAVLVLAGCQRSDEYEPAKPHPPRVAPTETREQARARFNTEMRQAFDAYSAAALACDELVLLEREHCKEHAGAKYHDAQDAAIARLEAVR